MLAVKWVLCMSNLLELDGVGAKTSLLFNKLGIYNIYDLITFYPKRYDILKRTDMDKVLDKDRVVLDGIVEGYPRLMQLSSRLKVVIFRIVDGRGIYNISVYNQLYLLKELKYGMSVIVVGKYDKLRKCVVATEVRKGKLPKEAKIEPVYGTTDGLNRKMIGKVIDSALNKDIQLNDYIPDYLVRKYRFKDKLWSIKMMHHPSSGTDYKRARQRLKYEEFFWYLFRIRYLRYCSTNKLNVNGVKKFDISKVDEFINGLNFELTSDQVSTVEEIIQDMQIDRPMNRLVQGDVGSGKTIVAFIASYMNCLAGYQTALMVPTEILAEQHYQSALELFKNTDIEVALLTSSLSKKSRDGILNRLSDGKIDFIIGTQSLIQDGVNYKNLGLIIADEQHRFGVNQRNLLKDKGGSPDILSMSATPIPRTYALTIYGDMDVSSIKTKPKGRKTVSTIVKKEDDILEVLTLMKNEIDKGYQVYVVAPAIDSATQDSLDNVMKLKEKMDLAFSKVCKIGYVHGGLNSDEKNKVMSLFEKGDIKILISTTVIEVGANVPNASMIVIFQANLFGLSTLHQLRGRVGRGSVQSYCILISKTPSERLKFLENTNDGFEISEYDFKNRGEGDLFGVRQSGLALFKLADIKRDFELLVRVKKDVDDFFDNYLEMQEYQYFKDYLESENILN